MSKEDIPLRVETTLIKRYALESVSRPSTARWQNPKQSSVTEIALSTFVHTREVRVSDVSRIDQGTLYIATSPSTSTPVKILHHDVEGEFIVVDKPGSIVRLNGQEGVCGTLQRRIPGVRCESPKQSVRSLIGTNDSEEIVCEQPLLTVDRQMGLNIVHPEGKGPKLGKGGIDIVPSEERAAPSPPAHLQAKLEMEANPEIISTKERGHEDSKGPSPKLLPRETGHDIGMGSPVPLSSEAVQVITNLRNMKDEDEDWSRWRDVVFRAKGALSPKGLIIKPPPLRIDDDVGSRANPQSWRYHDQSARLRSSGCQPPLAVATDNSFQTITPDTTLSAAAA
ncbi:uridine synthase [Salix suchowensis]|nr:uridine synthase [Salix suchowensis]